MRPSAADPRTTAAVVVWVAVLAGLFGWAWPARAQVTVPPTPAPATTAPPAPTAATPTAAPTTRPVPRTTLPRRASTTRIATTATPPPPTTVAGTLPPTTAGVTPAQATIANEDTRPGEGKMPAWPKVLSVVGLAGSAGILGGRWVRTRPR